MLLDNHPLFKPRVDPESGILSYLLDPVVAPIQQSFYYTQPSLTADERWLWLMAAWPPAPQSTLALVSLDAENPVVRHFPQAQFPTAKPLIAEDGSVWFGAGTCIHKMGMEGHCEQVFKLPDDFIGGRRLDRLATHLSLSADQRYLLIDGAIGNGWFVGLAELATGAFRLLKTFDTHHNHALFSPVDPELFSIAHDQFTDPATGQFVHHTERTFLMRTTGDSYHCINAQFPCSPFHGACHEWWSGDGQLCYIDYDSGAYAYDPATGQTEHVWKEPLCHAHCSRDRRFWCADESPYKWHELPCKVLLYDAEQDARFEIQSAMPLPKGDYWSTRKTYHIDPHPQVSPKDSCVVYTATNDNRVTVAITQLTLLDNAHG